MKLKDLIKLPEKNPFKPILCQNRNGLDYCETCKQAWEVCSCTSRNTGFNTALSQIGESEVKIDMEKIRNLLKKERKV